MEEVKQCYTLNSTPSSQTKTVGKSGKQKRVLNMSTRRLHGKFMAASGYELSFSLFRKFRPKNILLVEANCFRTGLCEQFLNVTFKTHAFTGIGFKGIPDKYSLLDLSLCHKEEKVHEPECLKRSCPHCGIDTLKARLTEKATSVPDLNVVKWKQWKTDPTLNKKIQTICVGTVNQLIDETCQDIASFSSHVHTAEWQKDQCKYLHNYLPSGYILSVQDFA